MVSFAVYLLLAVLVIENVRCSHFRGGIIMVRPRPGGGANEMEVFWHVSWRRDSGEGGSCTTSTIQSGTLIGGGSLSCTSGCSGTVASLQYKCTDFSVSENWSFGENKAYYTFPSSGTMTISFDSCCWISPFSSSWSLSTTFSMTPRSDTNTINSTPRAATSPVVRLQAGCSHKIQIAVSDPDDDVVRCRFATGSDCYDVCGGFPGATINSATCTISYTANQGTGYKPIALSIEDFVPGALSTPLSKVNLQFLVYVFSSTESCFASPYFVSPPTLKQGVCVAVDAGDTFTTQIMANSNSSTKSISEISTISPSGSSKGAVTHVANTNNYYVSITWTPSSAQQGQTHVICYTAVSSSGSTSAQTCIQVDAGILPPAPNKATLSPQTNGQVSSSNTIWSLRFDKDVKRPSISAFIKFHNAASNQVVYKLDASSSTLVSFVESNKITISPSYTFAEDQSYYITFEGGIVNSLDGCEPGNNPVTDKTFWTFKTPSSSVPASTVIQSSSGPYYYVYSVIVRCFATGLPIPTVSWYKDGMILSTGNDIAIQTNNDTLNVTQSVLTISSLTVLHEGTYLCNGTNTLSNGSTVSDITSFTITSSGIIVVNLTGVAVSSTAIYLSWDVHSVDNIIVKYFVVECDELETEQEWRFFAVETHANVISLHPHYSYSCRVQVIANGTYPFNTPIVVYTHQAAPSAAPQNPSHSFHSSSALNLTWYPPPIDKQNGIIQYYIINMIEVETNIALHFTSNFTYINLTSLHPYYSYTFMISAVTIASGPFSSTYTILMPEDAPTAPPSNISVVVDNSKTVTLNWLPPSFQHRNGIIRKYEVSVIGNDNIEYIETVQNTSVTINYLHPNYMYKVTIRAITIVKGIKSQQISFMTPEDAPSKAPTMFNATATSPYTAFLTWEPLPEDGQNGVIIGYVIQVTILETNETVYLYSNDTYLVVNTLRPYRTYVCIIAARTAIGTGPYGPQFVLTSPQDAPSGPPSLSSSSQSLVTTSTSFYLEWDPPSFEDQNGVIQYYLITVTEVETGTIYQYTRYSNSITVSSLHPAYTYKFIIAAYTVGLGPYSESFSITLKEEVPTGPPVNLTSSVLNSTTAHVSWQPPVPSHQNGVIKHYVVSVSEEINDLLVDSYTVYEQDVIITDLYPYYSYEVEVAAFTIGAGPIAADTFITDEDVPSSGPVNVSVSNITSSSVLIQWNPPIPDHHNGIIRYYTVTVLEVPTNSIATINTTNLYIELDNLHPYYGYVHEVTAVTIGAGPSTKGTFKLLEDVPSSSPQNVSILPVNATVLYVSWSPPNEQYQNGIIRSYSLIIVDLADSNYTKTVGINGTLTSTLLMDLNPFHTYDVRVAAYTIGVGPYSDSVNDTLPQSVPSKPPTEFIGILQQDTSVQFSWVSPPSDDINGVLLGYNISCTALNEHTVTVSVLGTTASIPPLHSDTHYTCTVCAYTEVGCGPSGTVHISTYEGSPIGPPGSVSASSVGPTMVRLNWSPPFDPDDEVIGYGIVYQLVQSSFPIETPRPPHTVLTGSIDTKYTIESLLANSVYRIVVFAVFDEGTGPVSKKITVTMTTEDSDNIVSNYQCLSVSSESLSCSWEFLEPPDGYYVSDCQLSYQLADGWDYYSGYGTVLDKITFSPQTTNYVLNGLHVYAGFIVELKYVLSHDIGSGDYAMVGNEVDNITSILSLFNTTQPEVPESFVQDFSVKVNSPTSVEMSWKPPPRGEWNGRIDSYGIVSERGAPRSMAGGILRKKRDTNTILFIPPQANHGDPSLASEPLKQERFMLEDLEENFEYHFSIFIVNSKGDGPPNTPVIQTMPESVPSGPPVNITAVNVTKSSLIIQWKPPNPVDANGIITQYSLNFTRIGIKDTSVRHIPQDQLSYKQQGLQVYENISVSIAAQTAVGWGPFSQSYYFNTLEDLPGSPVDFKVVVINDDSVVLSWKPPINPNGVIIGYQIIYSGHEQTQGSISDGPYTRMINELSNDNEITITNLVQGYFYEFKIRGRNGAGSGENTSIVVLIPGVDRGTDKVSNDGRSSIGSSNIAITTVCLIVGILLMIILVITVTCIVKRKTKNQDSFDNDSSCGGASEIQDLNSPVRAKHHRRSTFELPIVDEDRFMKTENNDYEDITCTVDELPDLKSLSFTEIEEDDTTKVEEINSSKDSEDEPYPLSGSNDDLEIQSVDEPNELSFL